MTEGNNHLLAVAVKASNNSISTVEILQISLKWRIEIEASWPLLHTILQHQPCGNNCIDKDRGNGTNTNTIPTNNNTISSIDPDEVTPRKGSSTTTTIQPIPGPLPNSKVYLCFYMFDKNSSWYIIVWLPMAYNRIFKKATNIPTPFFAGGHNLRRNHNSIGIFSLSPRLHHLGTSVETQLNLVGILIIVLSFIKFSLINFLILYTTVKC